MSQRPQFILTLACPDRPGIVHAVASFLVQHDCNIVASQQYDDDATGTFFMRVQFTALDPATTLDGLLAGFEPVAASLSMRWRLVDAAVRARAVILVSRFGHCLNDLLFRHRIGALPVQLAAVISNHPDFADLVRSHGIPFEHLPDRAEAEGFKGARPYQQAHARGVKLIGATAHYVTSDLDEGPIIEQDVERIDHTHTPDQLAAAGRDVECQVLARAVTWHAESRVLLNGHKTIVFR